MVVVLGWGWGDSILWVRSGEEIMEKEVGAGKSKVKARNKRQLH